MIFCMILACRFKAGLIFRFNCDASSVNHVASFPSSKSRASFAEKTSCHGDMAQIEGRSVGTGQVGVGESWCLRTDMSACRVGQPPGGSRSRVGCAAICFKAGGCIWLSLLCMAVAPQPCDDMLAAQAFDPVGAPPDDVKAGWQCRWVGECNEAFYCRTWSFETDRSALPWRATSWFLFSRARRCRSLGLFTLRRPRGALQAERLGVEIGDRLVKIDGYEARPAGI